MSILAKIPHNPPGFILWISSPNSTHHLPLHLDMPLLLTTTTHNILSTSKVPRQRNMATIVTFMVTSMVGLPKDMEAIPKDMAPQFRMRMVPRPLMLMALQPRMPMRLPRMLMAPQLRMPTAPQPMVMVLPFITNMVTLLQFIMVLATRPVMVPRLAMAGTIPQNATARIPRNAAMAHTPRNVMALRNIIITEDSLDMISKSSHPGTDKYGQIDVCGP